MLIRFMQLSKSKSINGIRCDTPALLISISSESNVSANFGRGVLLQPVTWQATSTTTAAPPPAAAA